jgi:hypothetical protein
MATAFFFLLFIALSFTWIAAGATLWLLRNPKDRDNEDQGEDYENY